LTSAAVTRLQDSLLVVVMAAAAVCAVVLPFLFSHWWSVELVWPGLAANFTATFAAFLIALAYDRRQRAIARREALAEQATDDENQRQKEHKHRETEAKRRFSTIHAELETNRKSIDEVCQGLGGRIVIPQLLRGAWVASAEPLGRIVADHELIARLGFVYGRIEELQWRLRLRAERSELTTVLDLMTEPLAKELLTEVEQLIADVSSEEESPSVQEFGLLHRSSSSVDVRVTGV
jgi:hypothetical protein